MRAPASPFGTWSPWECVREPVRLAPAPTGTVLRVAKRIFFEEDGAVRLESDVDSFLKRSDSARRNDAPDLPEWRISATCGASEVASRKTATCACGSTSSTQATKAAVVG